MKQTKPDNILAALIESKIILIKQNKQTRGQLKKLNDTLSNTSLSKKDIQTIQEKIKKIRENHKTVTSDIKNHIKELSSEIESLTL